MISERHTVIVIIVDLYTRTSESQVTKHDLNELRSALKSDIEKVRDDIRVIERDLSWIKGFLFLVLSAVVSLWFK